MVSSLKVVVDVNVWISGLLWGGFTRKIIQLAQTHQLIIFADEDLFQESDIVRVENIRTLDKGRG